MSANDAPREELVTVRARLKAALENAPATAHDLSVSARITEKEVIHHLEHLARSLAAHGQRLQVAPAQCCACGFVFEGRRRLAKPSRCPRCRSERIEPPVFHVEANAD